MIISERIVYVRQSDNSTSFPDANAATFNNNVARSLEKLYQDTESESGIMVFMDKIKYVIAGTDTVIGRTYAKYTFSQSDPTFIAVDYAHANVDTGGQFVISDRRSMS